MSDAVAASIVVACASCHARMRVSAAKAGKRGRCPKCGESVEIIPAGSRETAPAANPSQGEAATRVDADRIKFHCAGCGKSLKVPVAAIGKRVKCPGCQATLTVPNPDAPAESAPEEAESDMFAGLGVGQAVPTTPLVPLPQLATADPASSGRGPKGNGAAAVLGAAGAMGGVIANPLLIGILCSAIGAAIGGAIWCMVAYKTEREVGWIAWAVGILAGVGMRIGFRDIGYFPGMIAGGLASLGIIGGKFAVFYIVLQPLFAALSDVSQVSREDLADIVARRAVMDAGQVDTDDDEKFEAAVEAEMPKAVADVAKLNDQQVRERAKELAGRLSADLQSEMRGQFWKLMFSFWDVLFIPLAVFSAFRVASGVGSND